MSYALEICIFMIHTPFAETTMARLPTAYGDFLIHLFVSEADGKEHLALVMGEVAHKQDVLVRVHSECLTGDIFGSRRCDCGHQLQSALKLIADEGTGALVYLRQEGRGIGLTSKLKAYNLQDQGFDTVEANLMLGHKADERDYLCASDILQSLGIESIRLISNNPSKIQSLTTAGINVSGRVAVPAFVHPENLRYLKTKVDKMSHLLALEDDE